MDGALRCLRRCNFRSGEVKHVRARREHHELIEAAHGLEGVGGHDQRRRYARDRFSDYGRGRPKCSDAWTDCSARMSTYYPGLLLETTMSKLYSPISLGGLPLLHRVVMAPLTRSRAELPGDVPSDLMLHYYTQRAS